MAVFVVIWSIASTLFNTPILLPSPTDVFHSAMSMLYEGELLIHIGSSVKRLIVGMAVGVPVGALIGCAMGWFPTVNALLDPYVRMANSIPAIALIPFSLLWFGVSEFSRYALIFYTVSLCVLLSARAGVRSVSEIQIKAAQSLGLGEKEMFVRVVIPAVFPSILSGVRTGIGLGVMVIVAAEMVGASDGLGYLIMEGRSHFAVDRMIIGILGLGLLSLFLDRSFTYIVEHVMPRWSTKRRVGN